MGILSVLHEVLDATERRYRDRRERRRRNLEKIATRDILGIEENTEELVAQRFERLRANAAVVKAVKREGLDFRPAPPGTTPQEFPRALERVLETNDLLGMRFFSQGLQVAKAVARIQIRDAWGNPSGYGTGFLVSPRLLLTNNHVLPTRGGASRSQAEFNFQESARGEILPSRVFGLDPEAFFQTDAELDFTLVALEPDPALAVYGWLQLIGVTGKLLVGEVVNIIQHPNGEPKQLAIRHNRVVDELELYLHYQTDTDPGSSGAPVFNDQWEVVALHHSGVPKRGDAGEILTSDGRPWQEWMGEQRIAWEANEGVRVSRLVRHLRGLTLTGEEAVLLREVLEGEPAPLRAAGDTAPGGGEDPLARVESDPRPLPPPPPADLTSSWTIPLHLSVSVGSPARAGGGSGQPGGAASPPGEAEFLGLRWPWSPPAAQPPPPPPFSLASLAAPSFDWLTAHSLCLASELAYAPRQTVEATARAWGFPHCRFVEEGPAQGYVALAAEVVLVCFRGTESTADWLSNLNLVARRVDPIGTVHRGFHDQFEALQAHLEPILDTVPGTPLVITGHSLGGAIAVLAAATWAEERAVRLLCSFGQPAVGRANFQAYLDGQLPGRYQRLVNDADIVPRVPPGYGHTGRRIHFGRNGRVRVGAAAGGREATGPARGEPPPEEAMLSRPEFDQLREQLRIRSDSHPRLTEAVPTGSEGFTTLLSDHRLTEYQRKILLQMD